MKKIILLSLSAIYIFAAGTDIYDFDNSKYVQDKKAHFIKKADGNKNKINCINNSIEVKDMKKCFNKKH